AALYILFTRHILYAVLSLVMVSLGLSAIYFLQGASWIAVTYLLVYTSGVLVMILFATFMFRPDEIKRPRKSFTYQLLTFLGLVLCLVPLWKQTILWVTAQSHDQVIHAHAIPVIQIGYQLVGPYALLLEIAGILLLISVVGALYIVRSKESD
ncbi:MAG: NADH-quinone oxidoreductase subunit J, partial [Burkholderiales bacterium]